MTAFEHNNFCSETDQLVDGTSSNAFFINTRKLKSGKHKSRFTMRSVIDGYQYHKVGNNECLLQPDNYLIVTKGQTYYSEIESENPTEAMIVAFGDNDLNDVFGNILKSSDATIDEPLADYSEQLNTFDTAYAKDAVVSSLLNGLKRSIIEKVKDPLDFEERKYALLERIVKNHFAALAQSERIKSTKKSTRVELFKRVSRARDYMGAHLGERLNMEKISEEATLSPYHFFRTFKEIFQITPLEHLTNERLKYAAYLLENTETPVVDITSRVGFESASSFGRLFKKNYHQSPCAFRRVKTAGLA